MKNLPQDTEIKDSNTRRKFLKTMLAAGAAPLVLPSLASADHHKKKIKLGVVTNW
jgi:hypothetical protein